MTNPAKVFEEALSSRTAGEGKLNYEQVKAAIRYAELSAKAARDTYEIVSNLYGVKNQRGSTEWVIVDQASSVYTYAENVVDMLKEHLKWFREL